MTLRLLHSSLFPLSKKSITRFGRIPLHSRICIRTKMSAESEPSSNSKLTHTINLPSQVGGEPVPVLAAPGVSDTEFRDSHHEYFMVDFLDAESPTDLLQKRNAIESSLFQQWLKNIQSTTGLLTNGDMSLKQVLIQGVDMFGKRVGFLKFKADVIDKETGAKVPGIVFARGPAVAVLILLDSGGKTYAVLTEQVRVPVGRLILELPAGMLDDNAGDVAGAAIREVEEETGIQLNVGDMVDLTAFLDPTTGHTVLPSPGGCDEELSLLLYRGEVSEEIISQLQGKETGLREHGELIKVHVVPYEKLWCMTADAKVLMAIALYEMATREGLLPPKRN